MTDRQVIATDSRTPCKRIAALLSEDIVDQTDRAILRELDADPRLGMAALARAVEVSVPTARDRVRRLQKSGVIRGYRLDVDPAALGYPVSAFVRVRPGPGQLPKIAELAARLPQVSECHRVTGEDCFLLRIHATGIDTFEGILDQFLLYGQTSTSIIQSTPVPPRTPGLPDPEAERRTPEMARTGTRDGADERGSGGVTPAARPPRL